MKICTTQPTGLKQRIEILDPIYAGLDDKQSFVVNEIKQIPRDKLQRKMGELCDVDMDNIGL